MTKLEIFDPFFNYQVKWMFAGIEGTLEKDHAAYTCALALSTYTEIMGGLVTGNLKEERGHSKKNYEAFLPYLGEKYVDLNNQLKKQGSSLHEMVRNKLVHEFALRKSHVIWNSKGISDDKIGIEIIFVDNKIIHINFNLQEYYRDFKNGVNKYYTKLKNWKKNQTTLGNFLKATVINFNHDKKLRLEDFKPDEEP